MNVLQRQYFLAYGIMGCLIPFLPIYLKQEQGFREGQIGLVMGLAGVSILFTPVLMTWLADTRFDPRRLTALIFALSGTALLTLFLSHGFWIALLLLAIHSLAYAGVVPLHDGMAFSIQRKQEIARVATVPYNRIRVFGTIGFIVPSIILYFGMEAGWNISAILICASIFSALALIHVLRLPDPRLRPRDDGDDAQRLPTALAFRLLFRPHMRVFCAAIFLFSLGSASMGVFYPLYLVEIVGAKPQWVGLIFNFGVLLEIFFILGLGWIQARLGLRNIMIWGAACFVAQSLLLGLFPFVWIAILAQVFHGMIILALFISPIIYLNHQSEDRFRNSIQGIYAMSIIGISRIIGIVAAGQLAQFDLRLVPFAAAGLGIATVALFTFNFREHVAEAGHG